MGVVKIPYYVVRKGHGYWQPNARMMKRGAKCVACGLDGPGAWTRARAVYEQWLARSKDEPRTDLIEAGTFAAGFRDYRGTEEWRKKSPRTREEWERVWRRLDPIYGRRRPGSVTLVEISTTRALVAKNVSEREAHRCIKVWRALWQVLAALKMCEAAADPSFGVRNTEPKTREAVWSHIEALTLAKTAWRHGYFGLCAVIAVAWDTSFSPVDVRRLTPSQRQGKAFHVGRAKTGRAAIGTLTRRSVRVLDAYLARLGADVAPNAPIFRNRSGAPYSKDTLGDDFRDVRALAFGEIERRTLADFRRSGTVEAIRGGAADGQIAAKMANRFDKSAFLQKTYAPVDLAAVRAADEARRKGRRGR
jgi:hypothetical protein